MQWKLATRSEERLTCAKLWKWLGYLVVPGTKSASTSARWLGSMFLSSDMTTPGSLIWDCAFNCCQCCDSQVGPHICCLWCSWSRENWQRSLLQWAWVRTISWLSWFCIPKSHPLMTRGNWRNWKVHEVFWKGTSHHYKLEAINVSVSPQLSCHPSP